MPLKMCDIEQGYADLVANELLYFFPFQLPLKDLTRHNLIDMEVVKSHRNVPSPHPLCTEEFVPLGLIQSVERKLNHSVHIWISVETSRQGALVFPPELHRV